MHGLSPCDARKTIPAFGLGPDGAAGRLLHDDEPPPVTVRRGEGRSPIVLSCDHAGNRIPRRLGTLELGEADLRRHIAWDIGAAGLAEALSARLDSPLVMQTYSRLVIDCNRPPGAPSSIATISENTEIPGNRSLSSGSVDARVREVFAPYHDRIATALDARAEAARPSVLVSVHSFTPTFNGDARPWHLGLLYNRDDRVAHILSERLDGHDDLCVGHNVPYAVTDDHDYTIPVHGERRGIPHIMLEVRHDLIAEPPGQKAWADRLSDMLHHALDRLEAQGDI